MTDEQKENVPTEPAQEVDRIRDIIFGPQMRDYQQRFQNVERDLERLQQEIDTLTQQLADQDSGQSKKVQSLRNDMRKADDNLRDELRDTTQTLRAEKVDRSTLGELFIELGNHLKGGDGLGDLSGILQDLATEEQQ